MCSVCWPSSIGRCFVAPPNCVYFPNENEKIKMSSANSPKKMKTMTSHWCYWIASEGIRRSQWSDSIKEKSRQHLNHNTSPLLRSFVLLHHPMPNLLPRSVDYYHKLSSFISKLVVANLFFRRYSIWWEETLTYLLLQPNVSLREQGMVSIFSWSSTSACWTRQYILDRWQTTDHMFPFTLSKNKLYRKFVGNQTN